MHLPKSPWQSSRRPPERLSPDQLPVCAKDLQDEPLALICQVGQDVAALPFECDRPEIFQYCNYTQPTLGFGGCVSADGTMPDLWVSAHVPASSVPASGDVMARAPALTGKALGVELRQKVPVDRVDDEFRRWSRALKDWGCRVDRERYFVEMACDGWSIDLRKDIVGTLHFRAHLPDATQCLHHDPR